MSPGLPPLAAQAGPWPADSLRAVLDSVFAAPAYQWREASDPLGFLRTWWDTAVDWLDRLQQQHPTGFLLFTWGAALALLAIAAHAALVVLRTVRHRRTAAEPERGLVTTVRRDAAWYAAERDRLAAAGRFAAALRVDFLRLVLELDQRRVLRFDPSKTPNEYAGEAALPGPARGEFRRLVLDLYRYVFAGDPCGPEQFLEWRRRAVLERYAAPN